MGGLSGAPRFNLNIIRISKLIQANDINVYQVKQTSSSGEETAIKLTIAILEVMII